MQEGREDEALLWLQFKNGDRDAFAALYQRHIIALIAYGAKLCPDRESLKDQIQELFVELWNSRENLAAIDSIRFYLFKALRYKLIRLGKHRHIHTGIDGMTTQYSDTLMEAPIETSIIERELHESYHHLLKDALRHLTLRQQEIIQLRFYQGFSHEQIAELMDVNYQSVSNLLYKALCRLKERIKMPVLVFICLGQLLV
jgi:RNA polymerase sigma-70 factor (ECF subfamily)